MKKPAVEPSPNSKASSSNRRRCLLAYRLFEQRQPMPLVTAPSTRLWMHQTPGHFAYHCLPLVMANQAGWFIETSHSFEVHWTGEGGLDAVRIFYLDGKAPYPAVSMFGHGILTFQIPYLFRTPPGYNLLVRGPANYPKDGVTALEGLVETDWATATFTMNWQITRPKQTILFKKGEPICMIVPQRRGELESFDARSAPIGAEPRLAQSYGQWHASRSQFLASTRMFPGERARLGWQKHYHRGTSPDGVQAHEHQTRLRLQPFLELDAALPNGEEEDASSGPRATNEATS